MNWSKRLKRVFGIDIETCARYGGKLRVIASIETPEVIARILAHLQKTAPDQHQAELPLVRVARDIRSRTGRPGKTENGGSSSPLRQAAPGRVVRTGGLKVPGAPYTAMLTCEVTLSMASSEVLMRVKRPVGVLFQDLPYAGKSVYTCTSKLQPKGEDR
jgi:hypothetical protein